jgi:hypothetical protein
VLQKAIQKTPIALFATDLQGRIRPMMTLADPHGSTTLPKHKGRALPFKIPIAGKHDGLEAIHEVRVP